MNKITSLISLIIIALAIFVLGGGAGVLYQTQKTAPQLEQLEKATSIINFLSSEELSRITVFGKATKIEGRDITLSSGNDSVKVNVIDDSAIYSFVANGAAEKSAPVRKIVKFEEIKIGDNLNITVKLLPDGQLQGLSVIILP
ncbi:MAG: hypothetical protein CEN87_541 [Parcubacteria group bacterium Licking1014_1]|nr:MAG: hypothetical protein CEN87_541 [Parcubacteria group bacterium Licking1014_1]